MSDQRTPQDTDALVRKLRVTAEDAGLGRGPIWFGRMSPTLAMAADRIEALEADVHRLKETMYAAPIVSKFCMKDGFDENGFFSAYDKWSELKRAAISKAIGDAS